MFLKIHKSYRDVVAICDMELVGKKFEEDKFQLDLKESFYQGNKLSEDEIIEIMKDLSKEDATFNIVGKKSVAAAIKAGIISEDGVKMIQGIPYALILI